MSSICRKSVGGLRVVYVAIVVGMGEGNKVCEVSLLRQGGRGCIRGSVGVRICGGILQWVEDHESV